MFGWIRHHYRSLGGPENSSTASKQYASENNIAKVPSGVETKICADVDTVSEATKRQADSDPEGIDDSASEEPDDCESSVERAI